MEFRGWRRYSLYTAPRGMSLNGVYEEWKSPVKTAVCHNGDISECPMETTEEHRERVDAQPAAWMIGADRWHGCGIHSFKTLADMLTEGGRRDLYDGMDVYAEVVNYGRVDEFEHGYRAEHTRILNMYLIAEKDSQADYLEALRRILETRFGVPVVVTSLDDLIVEHAPDYRERSVYEGTMTHAFITHAATTLQQRLLSQNQSVFYVPAQWYLNGVKNIWQTLASASSGTTTSPNRSQRRSGNPSQSSSPSPSNGKGAPKKKTVESNLPKNQKKWWLKR